LPRRLAGIGAIVVGSCADGDAPSIDARLQLAEAMATDAEGYARALEPRTFVFPRDHGPHPAFATEWWYFTGNLRAANGDRFGYELTFFRKALTPSPVDRSSGLAAHEAYMAHFAVTDVAGAAFHAFDRFGRAAAGLAGARTAPFRVWLYDWSVASLGENMAEDPVDTTFPARVRAAVGAVAIDLMIEAGKPPVTHGEDGLSRKGSEPGNASFYYSLTRMPTRGTLRIGDATAEVHGQSWLDREWSTSALSDDLAGWDWFALRLDDGTELMLYRLRTLAGGTSPFSGGTFVGSDSGSRTFGTDDFTIDVLETWRSPRSGTSYPSRWRVRVSSEAMDLEVTPLLADQELDLAVRYWEGAVDVRGTRGGEPVRGEGYVELTGYSERSATSGSTRDALRAGR
jgi:predicted secreted hydrolase